MGDKHSSGAFISGYRTESGIIRDHGTKQFQKVGDDAVVNRRKKEAVKIAKYRKISDLVLTKKCERVYDENALKLTTTLLYWNPEFYTVWNYRRDILTNFRLKGLSIEDKHKYFQKELYFVLQKLRKFPKCYWIWDHRKWCLREDELADWQVEMTLVGQFFKADERNFHAWTYRRYIVEQMKRGKSKLEQAGIDQDEFTFSTKMINHNISNYSAWHNRASLAVKLLGTSIKLDPQRKESLNLDSYWKAFNNQSKIQFLTLELVMFQNAIYTDPDDSSVWIYVKWLLGDYFIDELSFEEATEIIGKAYKMVDELAILEKEDNAGIDSQWCLKTQLYMLKQLYIQYAKTDNKYPQGDIDNFENIKTRLTKLDPMRAARYKDFTFTSH